MWHTIHQVEGVEFVGPGYEDVVEAAACQASLYECGVEAVIRWIPLAA